MSAGQFSLAQVHQGVNSLKHLIINPDHDQTQGHPLTANQGQVVTANKHVPSVTESEVAEESMVKLNCSPVLEEVGVVRVELEVTVREPLAVEHGPVVENFACLDAGHAGATDHVEAHEQ